MEKQQLKITSETPAGPSATSWLIRTSIVWLDWLPSYPSWQHPQLCNSSFASIYSLVTSSNCLRSKPVPLPLLKGRNKNHLTCTEMVCQHLKDKLTGSPRLSPLHCSLQKTFWLHVYPHSYFTQHRSSFTSDFRIYYTLDSPICLTRSQHQTAQRAFLNPSTQDQRNQWGGRKKAYTPNPQSLHHKHSHCQHLKHHCHGNHGTFSPADRRAGKETLVSSLLAG